jgi:hypothetical protein
MSQEKEAGGRVGQREMDTAVKKASDDGFNAGVLAALAVLRAFDAETEWAEVVRTAGPRQVMRFALDNGDWAWGGFDKYAKRNGFRKPRVALKAKDQP